MTPLFPYKTKFTQNLNGYEMSHETGRASWFCQHYFWANQFATADSNWPLPANLANICRNHIVKTYFVVNSTEAFDRALERFLNDGSLPDKLEKYTTDITIETLKEIKDVEFGNLSNEEIARIVVFYFGQYNKIMRTAGTCRFLDRALIPRLRTLIPNDSNPDETVATASIPFKPTLTVNEELAILTTAAKIDRKEISGNDIEVSIDEICRDFGFGILGYFDEKPRERSYYEERLKEILGKGARAELEAYNDKIKSEISHRESLKERVDEMGKKIISVASWASYIKDYFKSSTNKIQYYGEAMFSEIAKRLKIDVSIKDLHPDEMVALLLGESVDLDKVRKRAEKSIVMAFDGVVHVLESDDADLFERKYLTFENRGKKEFKGRVASKGHAKGMAKVVLGGADFHKLEQGNILVVANTSPDFVPIMRKAAAIVAEEGGLTSHVSVVSREFGIPCVVGISHITDFIKDGDVVEVDAERGIVKILK